MGSTSYVFERYFRYALYGYMISRILVDQPRGEFKIPRTPPQASGSSQDLQVKYSSVFNHICMHGRWKTYFGITLTRRWTTVYQSSWTKTGSSFLRCATWLPGCLVVLYCLKETRHFWSTAQKCTAVRILLMHTVGGTHQACWIPSPPNPFRRNLL